MEPFISVIVTVYNLEKYIINCLDSLKNQTYGNFEVIIVNDGSKDNSAKIIEEHINENQLNNYHLYTKENNGISSTRNYGIEKSNGTHLFFLDGDDWLEPDALKILAESAQKYDSDLIIGGYQAVDDITKNAEIWSDYPKEYGVIPQDFDGMHSFGFCWGRLFKKSIIDEYDIRFDERIPYAEDNAWNFDYNRRVKHYSCSNKIVYNYRVNRGGALTTKLVTPQMKYYVWEHMEKFIEAYDEKDLAQAIRSNPGLNRVFWRVISTAIVNDILDKNIDHAKKKRKMHLAQVSANSFNARSKKDRFFIFIFKKSFLLLRLFVLVYYKNFEKLRKSKLLVSISKTN